MTRRKFTSKFKNKVVLEALKERSSLAILAQKYEVSPQQITNWKKEFLDESESIFDKKSKSKITLFKILGTIYAFYFNLIII